SECQEYSTREQDTVWEQNPPALVPHEPRAHDEVHQRRYGKPQEKDRREVRGLKCERSAKLVAFGGFVAEMEAACWKVASPLFSSWNARAITKTNRLASATSLGNKAAVCCNFVVSSKKARANPHRMTKSKISKKEMRL